MPIPAPIKPFPNYKWRWATFAPSEGRRILPYIVGVLRVLRRHEGELPNSISLNRDLAHTEAELRRTIGLTSNLLARDLDS